MGAFLSDLCTTRALGTRRSWLVARTVGVALLSKLIISAPAQAASTPPRKAEDAAAGAWRLQAVDASAVARVSKLRHGGVFNHGAGDRCLPMSLRATFERNDAVVAGDVIRGLCKA